jgi:hypothetical protein
LPALGVARPRLDSLSATAQSHGHAIRRNGAKDGSSDGQGNGRKSRFS